MQMKTSAAMLASAAVISLCGCSSLERSEDLKSHNLSAQVSTKRQVVDAIGLPRTIEKDPVKEIEVWHYTGKPMNTSYFVPMPIAAVPAGGGMSTVYYADIGSKLVAANEPVVLTLVFDKTGRLIQMVKPNQKQ